MVFVLSMCLSYPVYAVEPRSTNYKTTTTTGGKYGCADIKFRCTCVQDTAPGYFSYSSSITPPSNLKGFSFNQVIRITLEDHKQNHYTCATSNFSKTLKNALLGGGSDMTVRSSAFGDASCSLSVTR